MPPPRTTAELTTLVSLFYAVPGECGQFSEVAAADLPQPYRDLLAHQHHMTVTVEAFHGCPVDVQVLQTLAEGNHYSRKILLRRQTDGRVVQFGIVRLNWDYLSPAVRREIESQQTPLGRVLINHNVLREIELISLWHVQPGPDLQLLLSTAAGAVTYGRTAIIHCNGEPAVELLEIVSAE